jgi:dTMP kinase
VLVVFEGIDGTGKETVSKKMCKCFSAEHLVYPTYIRLPQLRQYLAGKMAIPAKSLILLFLADILWDQDKIEEDKLIFSCRYAISTAAYGAPGLNYDEVEKIIAACNPKPADLVLYFDLDPKIAVERASKKGEIYDSNLAFLSKVRKRYIQLMKQCYLAKKWIRIDTSLPLEQVVEVVETILRKEIKKNEENHGGSIPV